MAIFKEYLQKFMVVFVDDFTVYSSISEHLDCLRKMLQRCKEKKVCLNPYKSVFGVYKGVLLGHIVSERGIEMTQDKVKAIKEAVAPANVNEIASFLGFVNFYRRFVEKLVEHAAPMYALTKKEVEFIWSRECQEGFEATKKSILE